MEEPKNPEQKLPDATLECPDCEGKIIVHPLNATYTRYRYDKWATNLQVTCPDQDCEAVTLKWRKEIHPTVLQNIGHYATVEQEDYCTDQDVIDYYKQVNDIVDAPQYELTMRQERAVAYLSYLLRTTPDEQIMAELSEPMPERTTAWRWDM